MFALIAGTNRKPLAAC